jgi:hypothetical protein
MNREKFEWSGDEITARHCLYCKHFAQDSPTAAAKNFEFRNSCPVGLRIGDR